ncbi:MAG: CpsB/CapC family capsule biosynthesis tyrosine phosphatase [Bacillota bacterium]
MPGYIDLHNHILPGIDDGARDMEEAVSLARDLVAAGYSTVVATPHARGGKPAPALILERLKELQEEIYSRQIPLTLLPGAENHISPDILELLEAGEALTINNTAYLLLELPMLQPLPPYTGQLLQNLVTCGYRPVIPHPERVIVLNHKHELIDKLYRDGALYQVTWAALLGLLGNAAKKTVQAMLKANLAHLFATDAHYTATRLLAVNKAAAILEEWESGYPALMLTERPKLIIDNKPLDLPGAESPVKMASGKRSFLTRLFGS